MSTANAARGSGHRYPRRALWAALSRAGVGLVVCAAGLIGAASEPVFLVVALAVGGLFTAYGVRAILKARQTVILSQDGLAIIGMNPRRIAWNELTKLRLAYYTTRRDGENGWMELSLHSGRTRIALESELDGFADIAIASRQAAGALGLNLSSTTKRNFEALEKNAPAAGEWLQRQAAGGR